jgi:hypothetical protein
MIETMGLHYRATTTILPIGGNPGPKAYDYSNDPERQKLEDFLESKRSCESYSRLTSWFACDTPAYSARYLEAELSRKKESNGQPKLYSIACDGFSKQPMILVNAIDKALVANDLAIAEVLAIEYWKPTKEWKFWEYTTHSIRIVEEVEWPDSMAQALAFMAYQADDARLKQMLRSR